MRVWALGLHAAAASTGVFSGGASQAYGNPAISPGCRPQTKNPKLQTPNTGTLNKKPRPQNPSVSRPRPDAGVAGSAASTCLESGLPPENRSYLQDSLRPKLASAAKGKGDLVIVLRESRQDSPWQRRVAGCVASYRPDDELISARPRHSRPQKSLNPKLARLVPVFSETLNPSKPEAQATVPGQ